VAHVGPVAADAASTAMPSSWTHAESAASWETWETLVTEIGEVVKSLKTGGGEKQDVDAAVAELLHRKEQFKTALEAAISAAPDAATKEALTAKLPAAPKPSKQDKKKAKAEGGGDADAAKAANIKKMEEEKMAARAKKKAEEAKKKGGGGGDGNGDAAVAKAAPPAKGGAKGEAKSAAPSEAAAAKGGKTAPAPEAPAAASGGGDKKVVLNKTLELWFGKDTPPLLALLASRLAKREVVLKRVEAKQLPAASSAHLLLPLGAGHFSGDTVIARYFARLGASADAPSPLYGTPGDAESATSVDEWMERASGMASAAGSALGEGLAALNTALAMRTVLAGHSVSLADAAVWIALKRNAAVAKAVGACPHVRRWLKFMDAQPACVAIAQDFMGAQKDGAGSLDLALKDAVMGEVVTRFPPEPSGHLHIGHVKAAMLNAHFAEKYEGKMLLRFDDTNPSKEKEEYEEAIVRDLARLQIKPYSVSHTSDHFAAIKDIATSMIKDGLAYCDPSPQEEQQKARFNRQENAHRSASVEENLRLWDEMHKGSEEGLTSCLRAKMDMQSDNGAMRDPTIFRCNLTPHAQTKDKYKAYPTYDLACPIVDWLEGVTHTLRDSQYADRDPQYRWFIDNLQPYLTKRLKRGPINFQPFSRINFVRTLLSKRKLQWLIDHKQAEGWDDPRFPTVAGVLRRGMTVSGLKTFILSMGASKNTNLMEWDKIWAMNKAVVDPTATRYTALLSDALVPFVLSGGPDSAYVETLFRHPKDESLGKKTRYFASTVMLQQEDAAAVSEGEEVTLMSWGNAIVRAIERDGSGRVVRLTGDLHLAGDVKKTKKKLTWLADTPDNLVDVELIDLDHMLTKDKIEESDELKDIFNPHTVLPYAAKGEAAMRTIRRGETIQVERRGFYVCDVPYVRAGEPVKLFFVPDGKIFLGVKK